MTTTSGDGSDLAGIGSSPVYPFSLAVGSRAGVPAIVVVRELTGVEELSRPFRFDVMGVFAEDAPAADELLGGPATLTMFGARGVTRVVRGIVSRIRGSAHVGRRAGRLRIVPRLHALGKNRRSRVFQDKTVPEIIKAVLDAASIDCEISTSRSYSKRPYCLQYQESDLAFVSRLAAEEGVFYFFRQPELGSDAKEIVVFGDAPGNYRAIPGDATVLVQLGGALTSGEHVRGLALEDRVRSGSTLVRAYDQERPAFDVHGAASTTARGVLDETALSTYRHDADALEGVNDADAERLLDSLRRRASFGSGESTCMAFTPGHAFSLDGHPVDVLNQGYALVRVEHEGGQATDSADTSGGARYENRFTCVPKTAVFRPKRPVRKLQQTTETAVVVGPPGEEIHVDAEGRVKVQFPWDLEGKHDEQSSCWIRCMQPWAGASWGFQFIPRIGMEVVVVFVAGDVDRPMICGSVANGVNPFPYALPANKTQSGIRTRSSPGGGGSNELRFEDAAGSEQIYVHAQKNLDEVVEHDHTRTVNHGEAIAVAADRQVTVGGSQKRAVTANDELDVGQNRTLNVGGDHVRVVNGNEIVEVAKNLVIHVKGKQVLKIDGASVDGGAAGPDIAPPVAPPAKTAALAAPGPVPQDAVHEAALVWSVEQLPPALYPQGGALQKVVDDTKRALVGMEGEANGLLAILASTGPMLAASVSRAAETLRERIATLKSTLAAADHAADAPGLEDARRDFGTVASDLGRRADAADDAAKMAATSARELADGAKLTGGGGAIPQWKTDVKNNASVLDITGDAVIKSSTKLTLAVGGSTVEITPSSITLMSDNVILEDGNIVLYGKGVAIHSSGLVKIEGTPITLN